MAKEKRTWIIAEAGVNHNGSVKLAKQLIDAAKDAGADAVKFQTFRADQVISRLAPKAEYQKKRTDSSESQLEMVRQLELNEQAHRILIEHCKKRGIQFLSTPFDLESVDLLARILDLPCLKLPSGDITNGPLLLQAARTGKRIILSTGMSTLGEIEEALGVLAFGYTKNRSRPSTKAFKAAYISQNGYLALRKKVKLLHCTTEYPAPFAAINLNALATLKTAFGLPVGFSDHTVGIAVSIAAVALGAVIIEKHVTLDKSLPGPDHIASIEPQELKDLVAAIRQVEMAMGSARKNIEECEMKNRVIARRSLFAAGPISKGEMFTAGNIALKRPGTGISPMQYWEWVGKPAAKNYQQDEEVKQ
jgi:N-acetylneuraminate synthase